MNASAILRRLNDLDKLEKRIKQQITPSATLLKSIELQRAEILQGDRQYETLPGQQTAERKPVQK